MYEESPYRNSDPKPDPLPSRVWYVKDHNAASAWAIAPGIFVSVWLSIAGGCFIAISRLTPPLLRGGLVVSVVVAVWCIAFLRYGRNPPSGAYVFVTGEKVP